MVGRFFIFLVVVVLISCSSDDKSSTSVPEIDLNDSSSSSEDGLVDFSSCSSSDIDVASSSSSDAVPESRPQGLVKINSKGADIVVGTNLESAWIKDRPQMNVVFSYDFSIGRHEVTCGEYNAVMASPDVGIEGMARVECENDSLPASNMTFYDAVLFSNARSKQEHFDTAYAYTGLVFDADGHCIGLNGFAFRPEVNAYRLPTEAEWVFAARKNWNPQMGWTSENSNYKAHQVCSAEDVAGKLDSTILCDMAGNVMEWTNDWLGGFRDTTIQNFVGASDGGGLGERVLKGGGYRNAVASINLHSRGDVYTVTSSTRAEYVGFRIAFGAIPDAVWMGKDGKASTSPMVALSDAFVLQSITGVFGVKIAFRNDLTGNLAFVDYSNAGGTPSVIEIIDTIDSYHPDISPDGKKVAFCTSPEGVGGKSQLYVRNLSGSAGNLVKLDVESAAIPRWRVTPEGDTVIVYVSDAGNNKNSGDFFAKSTWFVPFSNGQFGIPQKLFDGSFHGGVSVDGSIAVTGASLLRAHLVDPTGAVHDTVWYNGGQACNVSLSQDGTNRTLFLDFGGDLGRTFVGYRYSSHEQMLVVDQNGNLIHMVQAPLGYSFDHSEWAPRGYTAAAAAGLAVASLVNSDGAHEKLALINLTTNDVVYLVGGDELWHPCLWIKPMQSAIVPGPADEPVLAAESAGVYLLPFYSEEAAVSRLKMEMFWRYIDKSQVLVYGSSRVEQAVVPEYTEEIELLNLAVMGIDVNRDLYFAKNYGMNHSGNLKAIALSLDFDYWRPFGGILDKIIAYPGYIYDRNHDFWKDGIPRTLLEKVEYSYSPSADLRQCYSQRGAALASAGAWDKDGLEVLEDSTVLEDRMVYIDSVINEISRLAEDCASRNIHLIGIVFPQAPQYKNTGSFGLYGIQRSVAERIIARFDSLAQSNPFFHLMDENKMGDHDYTDEEAANRDHLSVKGARKFTGRFVALLKSILTE